MEQYISKSALVAEIERRIKETESMQPKFDQFWAGQISAFKGVLKILDTIEVKEVQDEPVSEDLEKEILKYSDQILYGKEEYYTKSFVASIIDYCARIFANWQKKQILSQSIGRLVEWDAEGNASIDVSDIFGERKQEDDGEVIKVTIIKED